MKIAVFAPIAERQRPDDGGGEARAAADATDGEAEVAEKAREHGLSMDAHGRSPP